MARCNEYNAMLERAEIAENNAANRHVKKGRLCTNMHGHIARHKARDSRMKSLQKHLAECPNCYGQAWERD